MARGGGRGVGGEGDVRGSNGHDRHGIWEGRGLGAHGG
uniref:Uncharacterized protein n=1 Tax=Arundo donax TaxID=35708 RepID=A0A0A9H6G2_ARUDO